MLIMVLKLDLCAQLTCRESSTLSCFSGFRGMKPLFGTATGGCLIRYHAYVALDEVGKRDSVIHIGRPHRCLQTEFTKVRGGTPDDDTAG